MSKLYLGIMSGTSLDGIDISLCKIDSASLEQLFYKEYAYDESIKKKILEIIPSKISLKEFGELDARLGEMYAKAIQNFIDEFDILRADVVCIGLHGQTLWHEPNSSHPFSMQLCGSAIVSKRVGIDVVSDFRSSDIALGGQGAPFAPAFHKFMFKSPDKKIAVLNLGGIANISILGDKLLGYDIAPANILMDIWMQRQNSNSYDENGLWAKSGRVDARLLKRFEEELFFKKSPPKSTGRELFNEAWLDDKLLGLDIEAQDVQATLLELSVKVISNELKKYKLDTLLVCGGGAKNEYFMERLKSSLSALEVKSTDEYGLSADSLEAMAFAWLAYKRVNLEVVGLKEVTGALKDGILGAIYASN